VLTVGEQETNASLPIPWLQSPFSTKLIRGIVGLIEKTGWSGVSQACYLWLVLALALVTALGS
jgi:hypothetical protein